jgi:hypothetical protein
MTFAKTNPSVSLPEQGDTLSHRVRSTFIICERSCQIRTSVRGREGLVTAWSPDRNNVPLPRGSVNAPIPRNGVGRRAGVDPGREARAYTVGPTCRPQRATARKAPHPRRDSGGTCRHSRGDGARSWRAADVSRPRAPVTRRPVSATDRPSVELTPPSLYGLTSLEPVQGWGAPFPHSHRAGETPCSSSSRTDKIRSPSQALST